MKKLANMTQEEYDNKVISDIDNLREMVDVIRHIIGKDSIESLLRLRHQNIEKV